MKLHLKPDPKRGWKVVIQIPEHDKTINVGHLTRKANLWRMTMHATDHHYDFQAENLEEAHAHLTEKLQIARGVPEYVQDDNMSTYVFKQLQLINILACRTGSLKGWVSGIASGLGRFLLEDLPEGQDDVFWKQLREAAENVRDQIKEKESLHGDLESILSGLSQAMQPDDDKPPTMQ
jgi:hypothetical protein